MPALTPTVHERLARCGTSVKVTGLITGATVVLSVGGTEQTFIATGAAQHVSVAPLASGVAVTARQDDGGGFTPDSTPVIVEDAEVPPTVAPLLPSQVGVCSQCVRLVGLVPGCGAEILYRGDIVGSGRARHDGTACISIVLERAEPGEELTARMIVCGSVGPQGATPLVSDPPLLRPTVGEPVFGCQTMVPLSSLQLGARTRIETDTGVFLGWICNCWSAVNVRGLHSLNPGERVRAQQYWDGPRCKADGPPGDWVTVVPPDERIKPEVRAPLVEGDRLIRVTNQIGGADLVILIRPDPAAAAVRYGPRAAEEEPEIGLNAPLVAGSQVAAEQRLCGRVEQSEWVTVLPRPPIVLPPIVLPPLYACAGAVQVSGLHPGAQVRIYRDGFPCGLGWSGLESSITIASTALSAGAALTARQWVGGVAGPESVPVAVQPRPELGAPRIIGPVAEGDREVLVSNVTPGALVTIRAGTAVLGERYSGESLVRVGVAPVHGPIQAVVRLCDDSRVGARVVPIVSPGAPGPEPGSGEADVDYGTFAVPTHAVPGFDTSDGGFEHPVRGRLYFPADASGELPGSVRNRPLVIIAHGYWMNDESDQSHLGYAYLARHLARWGAFVLSLDLAVVNFLTPGSSLQQWSRGEVMLAAIDRLLADAAYAGRIDRSRVGLIGHSMSGEGVVAAQVLNLGRVPSYGILAVVSLAPTNYRTDLGVTGAAYLQLHGSLDYLLASEATGPNPRFGGFRVFDRAWRPRSHVHAYGGRHQGWNHNWWASGEGGGAVIDSSLLPEDHAAIANAFINALMQDRLFGRDEYRSYLEGLVVPPEVRSYELYLQHLASPFAILDDFGDADAAAGTSAETPIDKTVNRRGGAVTASGAGLDAWEDVENVTLAHAVHDTLSADLAWHDRDVTYRSLAAPIPISSTGSLSLRVAQRYDEIAGGTPDETWNPAGLDLDLFVELQTGTEAATVRLGSSGTVPYPAPADRGLSVYRTVRIPYDAFFALNPALSFLLTGVTLRPAGHATGRILIDDIESYE